MVVADDSAERTTLMHRGSLDLCVLAVLRDESLHAYGVVQRLAEHGFTDLSYGTVYPLVTRLRRLGLVEQHAARGQGGPARNVLTLTPQGHTSLRRWTDQWRVHHQRVAALLDATAEPTEEHHAG